MAKCSRSLTLVAATLRHGVRVPAPPRPGRRLALMSWNAGGLTSEVYQDLLAWLEVHQLDVATIQGTRWLGERTWTTRGYNVIQSGEPEGTKHVHSGLLTFISTRICHDNEISFSNIVPGRLMHVKCRTGSNSLDIVNVYQHPDNLTSTRRDPMDARGDVWTKLDRLLHRLPCRNLRIIAGDFNCPLQAPSQSTHCPADMSDFVELTRKYSLGSVRAHDGSPTYIGPQGQSVIDHVMLPRPQMDGHCRRGRKIPDFPVASWRAARDHLPIIINLVTLMSFLVPPNRSFEKLGNPNIPLGRICRHTFSCVWERLLLT